MHTAPKPAAATGTSTGETCTPTSRFAWLPVRTPLTIATAALAAALAGCAAAPASPHGEHCVVPVDRTIQYGGKLVKVASCTAWEFGPSRQQRDMFNRGRAQ